MDPESRQKMALEIFLSGLNDEKLKQAIRTKNPSNINDVLTLVKSINIVKTNESPQVAGVYKSNNYEIDDLKKQVAHLTQLVFSLRQNISQLLVKKDNSRQHKYPPVRNFERKFCSFCNMSGHSDSQCFKKPKTNLANNNVLCYNCNRRGHFARACPNRKRFNVIHQCDEYENDCTGDDVSVSISNASNYEQPISCAINTVDIAAKETAIKQKRPHIQKKNFSKRVSYFPAKYTADIEKDYDYITGRVSKNSFGKSYSEALQNSMTVNDQNTKAFKNRPIVQGRLNGENTNMFLDTGSEINVINQSFLEKRLHGKYKLNKCNLGVNCANGSKMNVVGSLNMHVQVGPSIKLLKFLVTSSVFPPVIIGLQGMKSLHLNINLEKNAVVSQGVSIPFNSRIASESELKSKNAKFLQRTTGLQEVLIR